MQRAFGLDLIRSFAIFFVMLCHGVYIIYPVIPESIGNILLHYGVFGVDLFFVLSGFLIGRIFLKDLLANQSIDFKTFWLRRWFRTLPNYYLFLGIHIILMLFSFQDNLKDHTGYVVNHIDASTLVRFPFFLQNFVTHYPDFFAQSWSLSVEEWFYFFLPFFFWGFIKFFKTFNLNAILLFLLITVIALLLWKFYAFWKLPDFYFSGMVIFNFDQIIFGVSLSALYLKFKSQLKLIRNYILISGVLLFLSGNLILVKYILTANPSQGAELWMHVVFILSFGLLVLFSADYYANKNMFTNLIKIISEASYSIYLSHMLILFLLVDKVLLKIPLLTNSSTGRLSIFFAFLIAAVAISYFVYLKFELPVLAFRDKFTSRKELVSKN